jgi:inhibitor of cysteine peptidase
MKFTQTLSGVFALILVIGCIAGSGCLGDGQETIEARKDVDPATSPSMVYLFDESSNGETVTVVQDSLIQIRLEENATTCLQYSHCYAWEYWVDDGLVAFGEEPSDHPAKFDGEPGYRMFELHPREPGTYTFKAVYKHPFEEMTGDEDTFVITFVVE